MPFLVAVLLFSYEAKNNGMSPLTVLGTVLAFELVWLLWALRRNKNVT